MERQSADAKQLANSGNRVRKEGRCKEWGREEHPAILGLLRELKGIFQHPKTVMMIQLSFSYFYGCRNRKKGWVGSRERSREEKQKVSV